MNDLGPGERAALAKRRRQRWLVAGLFAAGLPIGFFAALLEDKTSGTGLVTGTIPAWFAVLAAGAAFAFVVWGGLALNRRHDELERRDHLIAAAWGANALAVVYLPWLILWKGRLLPEPSHFAMFMILMVVTGISLIVRRIRSSY